MIARLVTQEHMRLRPYTPPTANQRKLDRLIRRRAKIVCIKSSLKLTMGSLGGFAAELKAVSLKLDALITKVDSAMSALASCSPQHVDAQQRLRRVASDMAFAKILFLQLRWAYQ